MEFTKLTIQEKKAIKEALKLIGYYDVSENEDSIQEWIDDNTISICTCRSGRDAVWIITESHESAVYIDTLEPLSQEEITKEFL